MVSYRLSLANDLGHHHSPHTFTGRPLRQQRQAPDPTPGGSAAALPVPGGPRRQGGPRWSQRGGRCTVRE